MEEFERIEDLKKKDEIDGQDDFDEPLKINEIRYEHEMKPWMYDAKPLDSKAEKQKKILEKLYKNPEMIIDQNGVARVPNYNSKNRLQARMTRLFGQSTNLSVQTLDTASLTNYGESYNSIVSESKRPGKIKNVKSRLYVKDQNAKGLETRELNQRKKRDKLAKLRNEGPDELRYALGIDKMKDYSELAMLLKKPEETLEDSFKNIIDMTVPEAIPGYKEESTEEEIVARKSNLLLQLTEKILKIKYDTNVSFLNDTNLVNNAQKFEDDAKLVEIYERLLEDVPGFLMTAEGTEENEGERVFEQKVRTRIEQVKAVTSFYKVRRMIIMNPYYRTHYNEECSMNAKQTDSPEQKLLSKLLRTSFYLGKNLQELGVSAPEELDQNFRMVMHHPHLRAPEDNAFLEEAESKCCKISMDSEDWDNDTEIRESKKKRDKFHAGSLEYNRENSIYLEKKNEAKQKSYKEYREELIKELERENSFLLKPEYGMEKVDPLKLTKKSLTKDDIIVGAGSQLHASGYIASKYMLVDQGRLQLVKNKISDKNGGDNRMNKKFGIPFASFAKKGQKSYEFGDTLNRMELSLAGDMFGDLTDNELIEMIDNLSRMSGKRMRNKYKTKIDKDGKVVESENWNLTKEQMEREEEYFLDASYQIAQETYKYLRRIMYSLGDVISYCHPKDLLKLMTPRARSQFILFNGFLTNMMQDGIIDVLRKYTKYDTEFLNNWETLVRYQSNIGTVTSLISQTIIRDKTTNLQINEQQMNQQIQNQRTADQRKFNETSEKLTLAEGELDALVNELTTVQTNLKSARLTANERKAAVKRQGQLEILIRAKQDVIRTLKNDKHKYQCQLDADGQVNGIHDDNTKKFITGNIRGSFDNIDIYKMLAKEDLKNYNNQYDRMYNGDFSTPNYCKYESQKLIDDIRFEVLGVTWNMSTLARESIISDFYNRLNSDDPEVREEALKQQKKMDEHLQAIMPQTSTETKNLYKTKSKGNGVFKQDLSDEASRLQFKSTIISEIEKDVNPYSDRQKQKLELIKTRHTREITNLKNRLNEWGERHPLNIN